MMPPGAGSPGHCHPRSPAEKACGGGVCRACGSGSREVGAMPPGHQWGGASERHEGWGSEARTPQGRPGPLLAGTEGPRGLQSWGQRGTRGQLRPPPTRAPSSEGTSLQAKKAERPWSKQRAGGSPHGLWASWQHLLCFHFPTAALKQGVGLELLHALVEPTALRGLLATRRPHARPPA